MNSWLQPIALRTAVAGCTHQTNSLKINGGVTLQVSRATAGLLFDINIVIQNDYTGSICNYSHYELNAVGEDVPIVEPGKPFTKPIRVPTKSPAKSVLPIKSCGLFGASVVCPLSLSGCGWLGRLVGLCKMS